MKNVKTLQDLLSFIVNDLKVRSVASLYAQFNISIFCIITSSMVCMCEYVLEHPRNLMDSSYGHFFSTYKIYLLVWVIQLANEPVMHRGENICLFLGGKVISASDVWHDYGLQEALSSCSPWMPNLLRNWTLFWSLSLSRVNPCSWRHGWTQLSSVACR